MEPCTSNSWSTRAGNARCWLLGTVPSEAWGSADRKQVKKRALDLLVYCRSQFTKRTNKIHVDFSRRSSCQTPNQTTRTFSITPTTKNSTVVAVLCGDGYKGGYPLPRVSLSMEFLKVQLAHACTRGYACSLSSPLSVLAPFPSPEHTRSAEESCGWISP